jgi:hypothetical protein
MSHFPPLHWGKDDILGIEDGKPQVWLMLDVPEWSFFESWNAVGDFQRPSL